MEFRILTSPVPRWNPLTPALQGTLQEAGEVGLIALGWFGTPGSIEGAPTSSAEHRERDVIVRPHGKTGETGQGLG